MSPTESSAEARRSRAVFGGAVRRVTTVAAYELRMLWRAVGPKILTVLLAGLAVAITFIARGNALDGYNLAQNVGQYVAQFAIILLPFILAPTFARDARRRVSALIWVRQVAPAEYALGKALAVILAANVMALLALVVGWVCASLALGAVQPIGWWLAIMVIALVGVVAGVCFTLLLIAIAPGPMIGAIAAALLLLYATLLGPQSLFLVTDLTASTAYSSSILGFGPDTALITAQRLAELAIAALCLAAFCAIMSLRERRGAARWGSWLSVALGCVVALALLVGALANLSGVVDSYAALGPIPAAPVAATSGDYHLAVTLDPDSGAFSGKATFTLTPQRAGQQSILLALNPGLNVSAVTSAGAGAIPYQSRLGWTTLLLGATSFAVGQPLTVSVSYAGRLTVDRDDYASASPGIFASGGSFAPRQITAYAGQGVAFLEGGYGNWYPLPWTTQEQRNDLGWQPIADAQVRVPAVDTLVCSATTPGQPGATSQTSAGTWQTYTLNDWNAPLPQAFCAALSAPQQRILANGARLFTTQGYQNNPDRTALATDEQMLQQAAALQAWLQPAASATPWVGVVIPLQQAFTAAPIIGNGLILLPQAPVSESFNYGGYIPGTSLGDYRSSAQMVAQAWWQNVIQYRTQDTMPYGSQPPTLQSPHGRGWFDAAPENGLLQLLSNYAGAALTSRAYGRQVLQREMSQELADSAKYHGAFPELSLYKLNQEIGDARTTQFLQRFVTDYARQPAGISEYLAAASIAAGHDFTKDATPYLPPKAFW